MGFGRTARGRSFVYHAGTAVDSVGGTCGPREGMAWVQRAWHKLAAQLAYTLFVPNV